MSSISNALFSQDSPLGPGTDLVVSLVAVLVLVIAINKKKEDYNLKVIQDKQEEIIHAIAKEYDTEPEPITDEILTDNLTSRYKIPTGSVLESDIIIENQATLQRFRFGSSVLFDTNSEVLSTEGENVIRVVGSEILETLQDSDQNYIEEIQIQGHADYTNNSEDPNYNVKLASRRAIAVFLFLKENVGLKPSTYLMSIASFGEYKPVWRKRGQISSLNEIKSDKKLSRHRRIEILLYYKGK